MTTPLDAVSAIPTMAVTLEALDEALRLSEERHTELTTGGRFRVQHSLNLHRSKAGVTEIEAMIAHLRAEGMPDHATLNVRTEYDRPHIQLYATWETDPKTED